MKRLRKLIFWLHLIAGLTFGAGIFLLAGTGVLMSFEHQIIDLVEHGDGSPPDVDAKRLPVETIVTSALQAIPDASPTAVTMQHDPTQPVSVAFGKERRILVNAYTGDVVGKQATGLRSFYRTVLELHRWLALSGDWRPVGRGTTGVVVVAFAILIIGGLFLWIPRKIRWSSVRPILMLDWKLRGKVRDWNWHNVIGFWSLVPLLILTLTGMVMSHTWANNALFRLAGDQPPAPRQENAARERQAGDGQ
ncbi:MAG: PepSY domain-containing protein, partial [Burkholderiales bacterium]|nr:PepSY domain-containing protein [Phycisphaerae bacterium]